MEKVENERVSELQNKRIPTRSFETRFRDLALRKIFNGITHVQLNSYVFGRISALVETIQKYFICTQLECCERWKQL